MQRQRVQIYLAHDASSKEAYHTDLDQDDILPPQPFPPMTPREAAASIAEFLTELHHLALRSDLYLLADLIEVAREEAKFHCHG